jgi:hypothetical protein
LFCVKRRARTEQIKVAPVNDVEALLRVWGAANKQGKDYGEQVFVGAARASSESAKSA